jgi:hypothetical protein
LTAILDEDERVAQQIPDGEEFPINGLWVVDDYDITQNYLLATSKRAVLADIAAKRAILDPPDYYGDDYYRALEDVAGFLAWGYRHRPGWRAEWTPDSFWPDLPYPHDESVVRYELVRRDDGQRVSSEIVPAGVTFTYRPRPWMHPGYPDAYVWKIYDPSQGQRFLGEEEPAHHVTRNPGESDAQWVERVLADVTGG